MRVKHRSRIRKASVLAVLFAALTLWGQPVSVPQINPPQFQSTDLDPYLQAADQTRFQAGWEQTVLAGLSAVRAAWEAQVDAQIQAEMGLVTQSDAFNGNPEYQAFLQDALYLQKDTARAQWDIDADQAIEGRRQIFLASLSTQNQTDTQQQTLEETKKAASQTLSTGPLADQYKDWKSDYNQQFQTGYLQFQSALGGIQGDYAQYVSTLNQKDQDFQTNLANIQQSEAAVRNGISQSVAGMQNYLASNSFFYNPDGTMNAQGLELQTLLQQLQNGLTNNAPLSSLVQQMVTYLSTQQQFAQQAQQGYINDTRQTVNVSEPDHIIGYAPLNSAGPLVNQFRNNDALVKAIADYIDSGRTNDSGLKAYLAGQSGKTIESVGSGVDVCGTTPNYFAYGIVIGTAGTGECYGSAGMNAFTWTSFGVVCVPICLPIWGDYPEFNAHVTNLSYTWYDAAADANAQLWGGYNNDLTAALSTWQNTLLPAITNWETQVADYKARYATWQADVSADLTQRQANYQTAANQIVQDRNAWYASMDATRKEGELKWLSLAQSAQSADGAATGQTPAKVTAPANHLSTILTSLAGSLPAPREDLLNQSTESGIDSSVLGSVLSTMQQGLMGAMNVGMEKKIDADARAAREELIKQQVEAAKNLDGQVYQSLHFGEVYSRILKEQHLPDTFDGKVAGCTPDAQNDCLTEKGREVQRLAMAEMKGDEGFQVVQKENGDIEVIRMTPTGQAVLRPWTDPTKASSYNAVMQKTSFQIIRPDAMKLAGGGDLFSAWDQEALLANTDENAKAFQGAAEKKFNALSAEFQAQSALLNKRVEAFRADAQGQATLWSKAKSLVTALVTGGTVSSWIQDEVKGAIAGAVEQATGLPAGFISGLMGGMKPHEAAASWATSLAWQNLEAATGIEGISSLLQKQLAERQKSQARHDAAKVKPEDLMLGPAGILTYTMRNAPYNGTLGSLDTALHVVPVYSAVKQAYLQGGGLNTLGKNVKSTAMSVADAVKNMAVSAARLDFKDIFSTKTLSQFTGLPPSEINRSLGRDEEQQRWDQYTGLDNLGRTAKRIVTQMSNATRNAAIKIQSDTLKGAADLAGNDRLKEQYKKKANLDYAAATDTSHNIGKMGKAAFYAYTGAAFLAPGPVALRSMVTLGGREALIPGIARIGTNVAGANVAVREIPRQIDRLQEQAERSMTAAFTRNPTLMDATAAVISASQGCFTCYAAYQGRKGFILGGDKGAAAGVANAYIQGVLAIVSGGTAANATATTNILTKVIGEQAAKQVIAHAITGSVAYRSDTGWDMHLGFGATGIKGVSLGLDYTDRTGAGFSISAKAAEKLGISAGWSAKGGTTIGASGIAGPVNFGVSYNTQTGANVTAGLHLDDGKNAGAAEKFLDRIANNVQLTYNEKNKVGVHANAAGILGLPPRLQLDFYGSQHGKTGAQIGLEHVVNFDTGTKQITVSSLAEMGKAAGGYALGQQQLHDAKAKFLANNLGNSDVKAKIEELIADGKLKPGATLQDLLGALPDSELNQLLGSVHRQRTGIDTATSFEAKTAALDNAPNLSNMFDVASDMFSVAFNTIGGLPGDHYGMMNANGKFEQSTCFVKGTLVLVAPHTRGAFLKHRKYYKEVQDIRGGDTVIAWNEKTGELTYSKVQETFVRETDAIYRITYEDGTVVETTWSHPFYIAGIGWVKGKDLRGGMKSPTPTAIAMHNERLAMSVGMRLPVEPVAYNDAKVGKQEMRVRLMADLPYAAAIVNVERISHRETVYNFSVADAHDYFVSERGALVHNTDEYGGNLTTAFFAAWAKCGSLSDDCFETEYERLKAIFDKGEVYKAGGSAVGLSVLGVGIACEALCPPAYIAATRYSGEIGRFIANLVGGDAMGNGAPGEGIVLTKEVASRIRSNIEHMSEGQLARQWEELAAIDGSKLDASAKGLLSEIRGNVFEAAVRANQNLPKQVQKMSGMSSQGAIWTVPDIAKGVIGEVKDAANQRVTAQIEAQISIAAQKGLPFTLIVSPRTTVAPQLQTLIKNIPGGQGRILVYDPAKQALKAY